MRCSNRTSGANLHTRAIATPITPTCSGARPCAIATCRASPRLLAAIGDVAQPAWRGSAIGVYRLWRDLGYAIGAVLAGVAADRFGLQGAMWLVAAITAASGLIVAVRMQDRVSSGD